MSATKPEQEFREFLASGRFMIQRSRSTGGYVFYPRVAEPGTGATDLEWVEASGRGTVHSYTVVAQKASTPDYNIVLVDLEEGPRLMSRLIGIDNAQIEMDMAVEAVIERDGETPVLLFKPVAGK